MLGLSVQAPSLPTPSFSLPSCLSKTLKNTACIVTFVGCGALMIYQNLQGDNPDMIATALSSAGVGISARTFQQINFDNDFFREVNNSLARWSLFLFEGSWQAFLNVNKTAFLSVIALQYGHQLTNKFFNMFDQKKGTFAYRLLNEKDLDGEEINLGTGFTLASPKKRIAFHTLISVSGTGLVVLGRTTGFAPALLTDGGCFAAAFGIGSIFTQLGLSHRQKKLAETQLLLLNDIDAEETTALTKKEKAWRWSLNLGQLFGKEVLTAILLIAQQYFPRLIAPAIAVGGLGAGAISTVNQITFGRGLTQEVYKAQQKENTHKNSKGKRVRNTALKIDGCLTIIAALGMLAYFGWGMSQSTATGKEGIGLFLGGTFLAALLTMLAEAFFEPGQSNVAINFLRYILFENAFLLPMFYLFFTAIAGITDSALQLDSLFMLIIGFIGLFTFGLFFGNVSVLNLSKNRLVPAYASSAYIFRAFFRILQMLTGSLSPTKIPSI